jgi:hypothetical protein
MILVFVNKDLDLTVEEARDLAARPVLTWPYDDIESQIATIVEAKHKCNEFKHTATHHIIPKDRIPEHVPECKVLIEVLPNDSFERKWLNAITWKSVARLVLITDAGTRLIVN